MRNISLSDISHCVFRVGIKAQFLVLHLPLSTCVSILYKCASDFVCVCVSGSWNERQCEKREPRVSTGLTHHVLI